MIIDNTKVVDQTKAIERVPQTRLIGLVPGCC